MWQINIDLFRKDGQMLQHLIDFLFFFRFWQLMPPNLLRLTEVFPIDQIDCKENFVRIESKGKPIAYVMNPTDGINFFWMHTATLQYPHNTVK